MNKAITVNPKDLSKLSDKPVVVLPVEEYERLLEDIELSRAKMLPKKVATARKQFDKGEVLTSAKLKTELGLK